MLTEKVLKPGTVSPISIYVISQAPRVRTLKLKYSEPCALFFFPYYTFLRPFFFWPLMLSVAEAALTLVQTSAVVLLDPTGIAVGHPELPAPCCGCAASIPSPQHPLGCVTCFSLISAFCEHRSSSLTQGWAPTQEARGVFGPSAAEPSRYPLEVAHASRPHPSSSPARFSGAAIR